MKNDEKWGKRGRFDPLGRVERGKNVLKTGKAGVFPGKSGENKKNENFLDLPVDNSRRSVKISFVSWGQRDVNETKFLKEARLSKRVEPVDGRFGGVKMGS